jgi:hypothetical protein
MNRRFAAFCCVLGLAACSSSGGKSASPTTASPSSSAASTTTVPAASLIGHVFVINLENKGYDQTWGASSPAHYLNATLRAKGVLLTQYFGVGHVSLDNYIAQISGQPPNPQTRTDCIRYTEFANGSGCVYPASVMTIADQLTAAGKTWRSYQEDMGTPCRHPAIGAVDSTLVARKGDMYATRHNPFVYFHSITDGEACVKNVVDLQQLTGDLATAATTPNLVYITPNLCDDGHDAPCVDGRPGGLVSADAFLSTWVPKLLASAAYRADGLLVITFDEADTSDASGCCGETGPAGGRVGALVISAQSQPGATSATPYNHYSLLCSMENVFGLAHLGRAAAPGLACFGKDVYGASP